MKKFKIIALLCAVSAASLFQSNAQNLPPSGRYIVGLKKGAKVEDVAGRHGASIDATFTHAFHGFVGHVSPGRLRALQRDASVTVVEQDVILSIIARPGDSTPPVSAQADSLPMGVARIDADLNPNVNASAVGIAIIDTGISTSHADLTVSGGVSYVRGKKSFNDDNGHGSHCAGIAAAKVNGVGVRGVAPGARLYAVKVLNNTGSGYLSWIISGIDWVTQNAPSKGIKVANMSLGMEGTSAALDTAINNLVAAGVTTVVAAGNSGRDSASFIPANHPSVLTVSAIVDTDGQCGGLGAATGYGLDDTLASFSNFGLAVDIAAPGVNIYSTYKDGGYATLSGTSMAAPHVAGAAALYLSRNPGASPATIRSALLNQATPQFNSCESDGVRTRGGFTGDRDTSPEPLLDAANL